MNKIIALFLGIEICLCCGCAKKEKADNLSVISSKVEPARTPVLPIQLLTRYDQHKISVLAVNKGDPFVGNLRLDLFDLKGKRLESTILSVELPAQASTLLFEQAGKTYLKNHPADEVVLHILLTKHNKIIAQDKRYFTTDNKPAATKREK